MGQKSVGDGNLLLKGENPMIVSEDDPRLRFIATEEATAPPDGLIRHYKDYWWAAHPIRGLVFWCPSGRHYAAQCNKQQEITCAIVARLFPWAEARFFPSVFRTIDPQDYV